MGENTKPQEIRQIEETYDIELKKSNDIEKYRSYQLDENQKIVALNLSSCFIDDISFLSNLENLQSLDLHWNKINDISSLSNLQNLQSLNLKGNRLNDINSLSNLENLQSLDLSGNGINHISSFPNLENLQSLDLSGNRIIDISSLSNLENLQSLYLRGNRIIDISSLSNLKNLQSLDLSGNKITDISSLSNLKNLQSLDLNENKITDISSFPNLRNLQSLDLSGNGLNDISSLSNLEKLKSLNLSRNGFKDISSLSNLENLQSLDLSRNEIRDFSSLSNLKNIQSLNLSEIGIKDFSSFPNLKNLQSLNLSINRIKDISSLFNLKNLKSLNLSGNGINDINSFPNLENLQSLDLKGNGINDISSFPNLENLQSLGLSANEIKDISSFPNLKNLQSLDLSWNGINDISSLFNLENLQSLDLSVNEINDINQIENTIKNLTLLEKLYISKNPFLETIDLKLEDDANSGNLNNLKSYFKNPIESIKKVMLLGNHSCGKSSFLDNFLDKTKVKNKESTHILEIIHYKENKKDLPKAIIYDFGGQDYYHGLYKAFMTNKATNLIFWKDSLDNNKTSEDQSNRSEYTQNFTRAYWIKQLEYYEKTHSKSWLIQTHIDENKINNEENIKFIDDPKLSKNIYREFHINNEDKEDIDLDSLKRHLKKEIKNKTRKKRTKDYEEVLMYVLQNKEANYKEFSTIKNELKLSGVKTNYFLSQLSNEGLILYYPKKEELKDIVWLNPQKTLEKINTEIFHKSSIEKNKGKICKTEFENICNDEKLRLMLLENKVIFLDKTSEDKEKQFYIIPSFLPRIKEDEEDFFYLFDMQTPFLTLKFEYFIPFGFINRLITTYGKAPDIKKYWRDMLLFTIEKSIKILIRLDFEELKIKLFIVGSKNKKDLEYIQRELFEDILEFYHDTKEVESNLILKNNEKKAKERKNSIIPEDLYISLDEKYYINYSKLENDENIKEHIVAYRLDKNSIDKENSVLLSTRIFKNFSNNKEIKKMKKIFISYSRKDVEFRDELRKYLSILSTFDIADNWACEDITIGKWNEQIQKELEDSDLIIYMLSTNFFASPYIQEKEILEGLNQVAKNPDKKVLPIIVSSFIGLDKLKNSIPEPSDVQKAILELGEYQFLPYVKVINKITNQEEEKIISLKEYSNNNDIETALTQVGEKIIEILK